MATSPVALGLPEAPSGQIVRENILATLDTLLEGQTRVASVEGPEGRGKTTLLAQFVSRHADNAIGLFISGESRWSYDLNNVRFDICNQLHWILRGRELADFVAATDAQLGILLHEARRRARRTKTPFIFVIDGFDEIPREDAAGRKQILQLLPFEQHFRFVFSGDLDALDLSDRVRATAKSYPLTLFSLEETSRFLAGLDLPDGSVTEVQKATLGAPGILASIRRLLESGEPVERILGELPTRLPHVLELEWRQYDSTDADLKCLLSILAHDVRSYSLQSLANVACADVKIVRTKLASLTFISISPTDDVRFVSDTFKRFAADRLADERGRVTDLLIADLLRDAESTESREQLPNYFKQAGKFEELLGFLSTDVLASYIQRSPSLSTIHEKTELGIAAAKELGRDGDLVRLTLQKSAISELDEVEIARAELRAASALGEYEVATAIAQSAVRREDRLMLLAALGRGFKAAKRELPAEIVEQIEQLHAEADFAVIGSRAGVLAADLLYSRPDLALQTIERANSVRAAGGTLTDGDWGYARLAIAAQLVSRDSGRAQDQVRAIEEKITNPKAKRLATEAAVVFGGRTATEAIQEARNLAAPEDQVYVLRQWMLANRERADALDVLEESLRVAIQATDYTPSARDIRELASCLPYSDDDAAVARLIGRIDGQEPVLQRLGPTEDFVRLQLIIARAEHRRDRVRAEKRLVELFFYVMADVEEFATRVASVARYLAGISRIDPDQNLEASEGLHSEVDRVFREHIQLLLSTTADHFEATRNVIAALAINRPELASEVAAQLNTEPRRDQAYEHLIDSAIRVPAREIKFGFIEQTLDRVVDKGTRDDATANVINALSAREVDSATGPAVMRFCDRIRTIEDPELRAEASARAAALCAAAKLPDSFVDTLVESADDAWQRIDEPWVKVAAGFEIAALLATDRLADAQRFTASSSTERARVTIANDRAAVTAIWCLSLAIRAYAGLLPQRLVSDAEKDRLFRAIDRIPSLRSRCVLWAELAERTFLRGEASDARKVVEEKLSPALEALARVSPSVAEETTCRCAAALYVAHATSAIVRLRSLSVQWRDDAFFNVCQFIKRKCALSDPYEERGRDGYDLSHNDAVDLCELLNEFDQDAAIYYFAEDVVSSLTRANSRLSRQQKLDIAARLRDIGSRKFPNKRFIQHKGWDIALRAQLARFKPLLATEWEALVDEVRAIPNAADRAYVLTVVAAAMRDPTSRAVVLSEATREIDSIPVPIDRIDHYRTSGELLIGVDRPASKELLKKGMQLSLAVRGGQALRSRRQIVDLAYQIDPEFASKLASDVDDDPAKDRVKRQIALHELKKSMSQERPNISAKDLEDIDYSRAAWMRLKGLNAGRSDHVHVDTTLRYLDFASRQPFSKAYPIFAWLIENAVRRHEKTDVAREIISALFEASLMAAELTIFVAARATVGKAAEVEVARGRAEAEKIVVEPNARAAGVAVVERWLEEHLGDYIKICDPYFTPGDVDLLRIVRARKPGCRIMVLTSRKAHSKEESAPIEDAYIAAWRNHTDEPLPHADIVIIGTRSSGDSPIHDRWFITAGAGLDLGTSWHSVGGKRITALRRMDADEAREKEKVLDRFLVDMAKEAGGERVVYSTVALG